MPSVETIPVQNVNKIIYGCCVLSDDEKLMQSYS